MEENKTEEKKPEEKKVEEPKSDVPADAKHQCSTCVSYKPTTEVFGDCSNCKGKEGKSVSMMNTKICDNWKYFFDASKKKAPDTEPLWVNDQEDIQITLTEYKGRNRLDIRKRYFSKRDSKWYPAKQGISILSNDDVDFILETLTENKEKVTKFLKPNDRS